jgi:DNA-binding FrmR family transcriptional regulator
MYPLGGDDIQMAIKKQTLKSQKNDLENHGHIHSSHDDVKKRLQRAYGHLNKVISMIDENKKCVDISMQLHAVVKALVAAKKAIIHDHIEYCLSEENIGKSDLKEFKEIAKYL